MICDIFCCPWLKQNFRWKVYTQKKNSSQTNVQKFDKVMVATGPFRSTIMPDIPGMKGFKGEIMHIKDYRQQSIFTGKRVLLVGKDTLGKVMYVYFRKEKPPNETRKPGFSCKFLVV